MVMEFFPRTVMGGSGQVRVNNRDEFKEIFDRDNTKHHIYISHNAFPGEWSSIKDTEYVQVFQLFFDLDHKSDLTIPLEDLRKLKDWHNKEKLPWRAYFSAGKGFHLYTDLKPAVYSMTETVAISTRQEHQLADYYKSLQRKLKRRLHLSTLDLRCAEPRRICRVSNSMHMKTGLYCIPLSEYAIDNLKIEGIKKIAEEPVDPDRVKFNNNGGQNLYKFHEFVEKYNVDPSDFRVEYSGVQSYRFARWEEGEGKRWEWFKKMMPPYPCVTREMFHATNPVHMARFASAVWWKIMANNAPLLDTPEGPMKITPTRQWVDDFYKKKEYDDLCERKKQDQLEKGLEYPCGSCGSCRERFDNINSVFNNQYHMPTCRTLYESEICLGDTCSKFKMFLKDVDGSKIKN
jgi:hypothetical protein